MRRSGARRAPESDTMPTFAARPEPVPGGRGRTVRRPVGAAVGALRFPLAGGGETAYKSPGSIRSARMDKDLSPIDRAKFVAARRAAAFVQTGMRVGLGTGSTAAWMVRCLGERVRDEGLRITGVPTSERTAALAREVGIPLATLDEVQWLDLTIDGADEFDADLCLIKGGGGALLREKIVATASDQMIVIADAAKEVATLGAFPLPVEVIPFGWRTTKALIEEALINVDVLARGAELRMAGDVPFVSDEGNRILDLDLKRIGNPRQLSLMLNQIPGVVENGLFIDICDVVVIGHSDARVEVRDIQAGSTTEERIALADEDNIFADLAE
jgi:ribose 5-phosphate isomerase A